MKKYSFGLSIISLVGGCIINFSGEYSDSLILILLLLFLIDIISYLATGIIKESLTWKSVLKEIMKHVSLVTIIIISYILDFLLGTEDRIKNSTLLFYIGYEMISIIGYAVSAGVPMPDIIIKYIEQVQAGKAKNESDTETANESDKNKKSQ